VLEDAYTNSKKETAIHNRMWLDSPWAGFFDKTDPMKLPSTGIHEETLQHIAKVFSTEPGGEMTLHSGELGDNITLNISSTFQNLMLLTSCCYCLLLHIPFHSSVCTSFIV